ncbi:transcription termination factor Rho [Leucobacter japonicus]|uniref:transcription termination factor Rho n=1 Tax=Leucobacter japonicus TaxID=1461259 RepID=UPI0006A7D026|nr:transcription termination factor Rho [Leucobacter japonicus]
MESNVDDTTTPAAADAAAPTETAPPRRRASRRVSAAAGAAVASEPAAAEAAAAAVAPAAESAAAPVAEAAAAPAEAAEAPKKRATRSRKKVEAPAADAEAATDAAAAEAPAAEAAEAPKKRATRSRKKVEAPAADAAAEAPAADAAAPAADSAESEASEAPAKRTRSRRASAATAAPQTAESAESEGAATPAAEQPAADAPAESAGEAAEQAETGESERPSRNRRGRGRGQKNDAEGAESTEPAADDENESRQNGKGQGGNSQNGQRQNGQGQNGPKDDKGGDNSNRSSRTRQRDRKRRGQGDDLEPEITEDDVLLPIAGILDVLDNYAFVRTSGYLPGTSDVYVSLGQVKKYGLRRGDAVVGAIRQPGANDGASRQKYNAIVKIDTINGRPVDEQQQRADIAELTPIYPQERLRFETAQSGVLGRAIDLVAPAGLGQRTALVLPAGADGTALLGELAEAVSTNRPDAHLLLVLANAQPEEVTRLQRSVRGEVVAATFDRSAEDQATIAELAIDRAKRLVELGHDVVVLVDSLNRFARAYAQAQHAQSRPGLEEIDEFALAQIKRLLSAARNVENGGSLTVVATVQTKTGLSADKFLLREVLAVVNSEVRIAKAIPGLAAEVDFAASRTRQAESVLGADEAGVLARLRAELTQEGAQDRLRERLAASASNAALLVELQRSGTLS